MQTLAIISNVSYHARAFIECTLIHSNHVTMDDTNMTPAEETQDAAEVAAPETAAEETPAQE